MGARILLLTEYTENIAKFEMALNRFGYSIASATRLPQALDIVNNDSTIDLIISDLNLSRFESFDLIKHVRADHLLSNLPYIFLCQSEAELTGELRKAASIYGADKFLFMDQFEPHRFRLEIAALLPAQETEKIDDLVPPMDLQGEESQQGGL